MSKAIKRLGDQMQARLPSQAAVAARVNALCQNHDIQNANRSGALSSLGLDAPAGDTLQNMLAPIGTRQYVAAQDQLFAQNDEARCYHFVVCGQLVAVRRCLRSNPAVRFLMAGDLFVFDCDGLHIASCYAVLDSQLLRIDRQLLTELAQRDPALMQMLHAVHAAELEMILQARGSSRQDGPCDVPQPQMKLASMCSVPGQYRR